jgi:excisionase family DNA binding protein
MCWEGEMESGRTTPAFFTPRTLGERWQVSVRTVRRIIQGRQITIHRVGRQLRIARADVLDFERGRRELN